MFKNGFGINNLQWLMSHKTKQTESRLKNDSCKTPHICCRPCKYNFTMPMYSCGHPRDMLSLIYTVMSCNHLVYTAGTFGTVKGQYATSY